MDVGTVFRLASTPRGLTDALRHAALVGCTEVVVALLADGRADPAANASAPLYSAAVHGFNDLLLALLADGRANPAACRSDALSQASSRGNTHAVRALLADRRADPAAVNSAALRNAAFWGHLDVVAALIEDGRVNFAVATVVQTGASRGYNQPVTQQLVRHARWLRRRTWVRARAP
jgi:hypothetical protein